MTDLVQLSKDLREAAEKAGGVQWHAGHLANDAHSCNCRYIFDEEHCGGIGEVYVDNGLPVSQGGKDEPSLEEAKANLRHIALANPANIIALLDDLERKKGELSAIETALVAAGQYQLVGDDRTRADRISGLADDALRLHREKCDALDAIESKERAMAQAYQAVGALIEVFGLDDNEHMIRLLDMLAYGKTQDGKDLLPFPCTLEDLSQHPQPSRER